MNFQKDYYKILEVEPGTSMQAIRAAYRKLAYKHHPDRNPDDPAAEETLKNINEAYKVLFNEFTRSVYDESRKLEQEAKDAADKHAKKQHISIRNKTTKTKTHIVVREHKVYIAGRILIKYVGDRLTDDIYQPSPDTSEYDITPTYVHITICASNVYRSPESIPPALISAFRDARSFTTPLKQPVHCIIVHDDMDEEHFNLEVKDVRVHELIITHTQKEDDSSLGTLEGYVYGYVPKNEQSEIEIDDTTCFGETGNVEFKQENEQHFFRKEFYNKDCSTYWEGWTKTKMPPPPQTSRSRRNHGKSSKSPALNELSGCSAVMAILIWIVPLLWLVSALSMPVILGLLICFGLIYLLSKRFINIGTIVPVLTGILMAAFISYFLSGRLPSASGPQPSPAYDSLNTSNITVTDHNNKVSDAFVSHFIRWKDYRDSSYSLRLEVKRSDIIRSTQMHQEMQINLIRNSDISMVYQRMVSNDSGMLSLVYKAFDTLRATHRLTEQEFAEAIVSCIQSVRYCLVLEGNCEAADYAGDAFVSSYLSACRDDCCIGGERFGVRAPAEMLGDLKGDCDSRALLLYTILKHYHYDVALLTSFEYKHALLAIHFRYHTVHAGISLIINNQPYFLWETTNKGFGPGNIPVEISNTSNWQVSLIYQENNSTNVFI